MLFTVSKTRDGVKNDLNFPAKSPVSCDFDQEVSDQSDVSDRRSPDNGDGDAKLRPTPLSRHGVKI